MRSSRDVAEIEQSALLGRNSDPTMLVLASMASGAKHGHAMIEDIERLAGSRLGPGTLYGAIGRLEQQGWIQQRPNPQEDRLDSWELTPRGRALALSPSPLRPEKPKPVR